MFEAALTEAINEWLVFQNILPSTLNQLTDEFEVNIFEAEPVAPAAIPCILHEIMDTKPLSESNPVSSSFRSKILIYCVDFNGLKSKQICDNLCILLTNRPVDAGSDWFPDMSNQCINTRFVKFVRRFKYPDRFDTKTDVYTNAIEVDIVWSYCCTGTLCDEFVYCTTTSMDPEDEIEVCRRLETTTTP